MEENTKSVHKLHEITDVHYATILKARESWSMFSIMSEFIESTERLSDINPAVTIFGSARIHPDNPYYIPVSYTHLDVYKRQPFACSSNRFAISSIGPRKTVFPTFFAVA